ncbi:hypothetical protein BaRGS_00024167 [Batillaria attramentaria]|uniref:Sorbitol dehydrogenase n=1 Tax=Batillaria attramentaria TaxID=370345 RepID=A0ABD0KC00_9CAEN
MAGINRSVVLYGKMDIRLENRSIPKPGTGELQIRIRAVGICGSDLSVWRAGRVGNFLLKQPMVLGHEPCGVVTALGLGVTTFAVGDRVVFEPSVTCGTCTLCKAGRYNLCPQVQAMATPPCDGALADYVVWPATLCHKAGVRLGTRVLICGAGPLGSVVTLAARAGGATRICVTDINEERLKFLAGLCPCTTVLVKGESPKETSDHVISKLGGQPDVSFECSGVTSSLSVAIYATRPAGTILLGGILRPEVEVPLLTAATKEVDVKGMLRFANTFSIALDLLTSGLVDVKPLVTHKFPLEDAEKAFQTAGTVAGKVYLREPELSTVTECGHPAVVKETRPIPLPSQGEVQIHIRSVGICGSDLSVWRSGRVGPFLMDKPLVLGHEPCGVVTAFGQGVTTLAVGDRVAIEPNAACGTCTICTSGRYNLCPHVTCMACPEDGALANFLVWPARLCYKLPAELSWTEGAGVQPMALAVHACHRAGVRLGTRVLICGAGPLGMVIALAARAGGATRLCIIDKNEDRLKFIAGKVPCSTVLVGRESAEETADHVISKLGGQPDVSMECTGADSAISVAIFATKPAGCILLAGIGRPEVQIPLLTAANKEVDIKSMFMLANTYPIAIDLMTSGLVDVKPLVTHKFSLRDAALAFEAADNGVEGKLVIECHASD